VMPAADTVRSRRALGVMPADVVRALGVMPAADTVRSRRARGVMPADVVRALGVMPVADMVRSRRARVVMPADVAAKVHRAVRAARVMTAVAARALADVARPAELGHVVRRALVTRAVVDAPTRVAGARPVDAEQRARETKHAETVGRVLETRAAARADSVARAAIRGAVHRARQELATRRAHVGVRQVQGARGKPRERGATRAPEDSDRSPASRR